MPRPRRICFKFALVLCSSVAFILAHRAYKDQARQSKPSTNQLVAPVTYYSAHGQDRWILDNILSHAGNKSMFTFVEAGSYDGLTGSNMAAFELRYGWTGLCYEPNPVMFELVKQRRPKCEKFNAVICDAKQAAGGTKYYYRQLAAPYQQESGIFELMDSYKQDLVKQYTVEAELQVSCRSLSEDIKTYLNGQLDFLSLDVEGAELIVLQTIDWEQVSVDIIMVERSHEKQVHEFLVGRNFHHVALVGHDNVFVHKRSRFIEAYMAGCSCKLRGECKSAKVYPDAGWLNCEKLESEALEVSYTNKVET